MNPTAPNTYPRRILLMVTGRSPQVVTETIYALCREQNPPFIPTEVRIVTTSEGAQDARLSLLSDDPGWFKRLCQDWDLPEMCFGPEQIQVLPDADGQPLADIRTHADNDQAADAIVDTVRRITEDDECALHVSLAGGRKTMGYFLGYALSLYGRPQDRLSHVLVAPPFESNRDFFYPTPSSRIIYTAHAMPTQQRPLDARDGTVTLAEIPFVRLRDILPSPLKGLQTGTQRFSDIVAAAQRALLPPAVTVDYRAEGLRIADGSFVELGRTDLAFYGWLARRRQLGAEPVLIPPESAKQWTEEQRTEFTLYLSEYLREAEQAIVPDSTAIEPRAIGAMTYDFFHQRKNAIKKRLEQALGPLAARYAVRRLVQGRPARFGLDVAPGRIQFVEEAW